MYRAFIFLILIQNAVFAAAVIEGEVLAVDAEAKIFEVEVLKPGQSEFACGSKEKFRVSRGDLEIGYLGRQVRANSVFYGNAWHLEQVFPIDGEGAQAVAKVNGSLHDLAKNMPRRKYLKKGHAVPNFGMIDHDGEFVQFKDLKGKAIMLNFIFTRCAVAKMCPASSMKMETIQEQAREEGLKNLHFVTISFDPAFDSPGILRTYAKGYEMELDNFHLLTGTQEVVDDLLRLFGVLTMEEDGTINHTIATLLIDAEGRVAYREEGPGWKVKNFLKAARKL